MKVIGTPVAVLFLVAVGAPAPAAGPTADEDLALRADSRAPYLHRIRLYDENGKALTARDDRPYSPRVTCGKCHDYAEISKGWHFSAADPAVPPGRAGEPWILTDPKTHTQLPISSRRWPGTFRPQDVGLSPEQFVRAFGRHFPGGSVEASLRGRPQGSDFQPLFLRDSGFHG